MGEKHLKDAFVTIRLTHPMGVLVDHLADEKDITRSEVIREAIGQYLRRITAARRAGRERVKKGDGRWGRKPKGLHDGSTG